MIAVPPTSPDCKELPKARFAQAVHALNQLTLRPHYHANYHGAFVLDRDGNNVEAVCHKEA
jgi:hypothetical protein